MSTSNLPDVSYKALAAGEYSDLTIRVNTVSWRVHKVVVCSQSDVFKRMMESGFEEGKSNIIMLPDDEIDVVRKMNHFLYHSRYDSYPIRGEEAPKKMQPRLKENRNPYILAAKLTLIADKYSIQTLHEYALNIFRTRLTHSPYQYQADKAYWRNINLMFKAISYVIHLGISTYPEIRTAAIQQTAQCLDAFKSLRKTRSLLKDLLSYDKDFAVSLLHYMADHEVEKHEKPKYKFDSDMEFCSSDSDDDVDAEGPAIKKQKM